MASITTRSGKGSPLTSAEVDANFTGLNTEVGSKVDAAGAAAAAPVQSVAGKTGAVSLSTTDVSEGSNQYHTTARVRAAISVTGSGSYDSSTGVITVTGGVTSVAGRTGVVTLAVEDVSGAQPSLVSGTNIKTLNGSSVLGSGNLELSGGMEFVAKTANYTAVDKQGVLADTTGGAFTVTLPASPSVGAQVVIADSGGVWGTNNLTVGRNGSTISNLAENLVCDISGASVQLIFDGATWEVYAQVGGNGGTAVTLAGAQALTNKDLTSATNTFPSSLATLSGNQTLTNKTLSTGSTWSGNAVGAANGGTGRTSLTSNNVILGAGTSAVNFVAPGTNGNVLTSNGSTWTSAAPSGGVTSVLAGDGIQITSTGPGGQGAVTVSLAPASSVSITVNTGASSTTVPTPTTYSPMGFSTLVQAFSNLPGASTPSGFTYDYSRGLLAHTYYNSSFFNAPSINMGTGPGHGVLIAISSSSSIDAHRPVTNPQNGYGNSLVLENFFYYTPGYRLLYVAVILGTIPLSSIYIGSSAELIKHSIDIFNGRTIVALNVPSPQAMDIMLILQGGNYEFTSVYYGYA
jgi:hypothetical protein